MEITGQLVKVLDAEAGITKAGAGWLKQSFVINTGAQYNPEVCFTLFGQEKIDLLKDIKLGDDIEVAFNLSSREYNGKYYHNIDAWKIKAVSMTVEATKEENDDCPF